MPPHTNTEKENLYLTKKYIFHPPPPAFSPPSPLSPIISPPTQILLYFYYLHLCFILFSWLLLIFFFFALHTLVIPEWMNDQTNEWLLQIEVYNGKMKFVVTFHFLTFSLYLLFFLSIYFYLLCYALFFF